MSSNIASYSYPTASNTTVLSFESISRNSNIIKESASITEWIDAPELVSLEEQKTTNNAYTEIRIDLAKAFVGFFPLIKGLLASGNFPFTIHSAGNSKNFVLRMEESQKSEAKKHLSTIFGIVKAEARFKQVLRKIILNQKIYEREQRLLFSELSK